eukprot:3237450-Ditylum_brightwellii.AAC.2
MASGWEQSFKESAIVTNTWPKYISRRGSRSNTIGKNVCAPPHSKQHQSKTASAITTSAAHTTNTTNNNKKQIAGNENSHDIFIQMDAQQ